MQSCARIFSLIILFAGTISNLGSTASAATPEIDLPPFAVTLSSTNFRVQETQHAVAEVTCQTSPWYDKSAITEKSFGVFPVTISLEAFDDEQHLDLYRLHFTEGIHIADNLESLQACTLELRFKGWVPASNIPLINDFALVTRSTCMDTSLRLDIARGRDLHSLKRVARLFNEARLESETWAETMADSPVIKDTLVRPTLARQAVWYRRNNLALPISSAMVETQVKQVIEKPTYPVCK